MEGDRKKRKRENSFDTITKEAVALIMQKLPIRDAVRLGSTEKRLYGILNNTWSYFLGRDYQVSDQEPRVAYEEEFREAGKKPSEYNLSALVQRGQRYAIKRYIRLGINPARSNNYAIREAAAKGYADVVRLLLADGRVDPAANDNEAIRSAAKNGHAAVVELLLADDRVGLDYDDNQAIGQAAANGHLDVIKLLMADGRVDFAADDNVIINSAIRYRRVDIVKLLLSDKKFDPYTENDMESVYKAVRWGHTSTIKVLLDDGRIYDPYFLDLAVKNRCIDIVKLLLADKRTEPRDGISVAAEHQHLDIVELLDPLTPLDDGLLAAAKHGHFALFLFKLPFNEVDLSAPLAVASENSHFELVDFLLAAEKSKKVMDLCIKTARKRKFGKILAYLFRHR